MSSTLPSFIVASEPPPSPSEREALEDTIRRQAARLEKLQDAVNRYDVYDRCLVTHDRKVHVLGVLRAMLTEAEQCE
jgi:hypothetical protein